MAAMAEIARRCWIDPWHSAEENRFLHADGPQERWILLEVMDRQLGRHLCVLDIGIEVPSQCMRRNDRLTHSRRDSVHTIPPCQCPRVRTSRETWVSNT